MFSFHQDRLGAVACLQLAVKHFKIDDHVVVIGGYVLKLKSIDTTMQRRVRSWQTLFPTLNSDTLFKEDFSLREVKEKFSDRQAKNEDSCLVLSYQCKDEGEFCSMCMV